MNAIKWATADKRRRNLLMLAATLVWWGSLWLVSRPVWMGMHTFVLGLVLVFIFMFLSALPNMLMFDFHGQSVALGFALPLTALFIVTTSPAFDLNSRLIEADQTVTALRNWNPQSPVADKLQGWVDMSRSDPERSLSLLVANEQVAKACCSNLAWTGAAAVARATVYRGLAGVDTAQLSQVFTDGVWTQQQDHQARMAVLARLRSGHLSDSDKLRLEQALATR